VSRTPGWAVGSIHPPNWLDSGRYVADSKLLPCDVVAGCGVNGTTFPLRHARQQRSARRYLMNGFWKPRLGTARGGNAAAR
jgi:hypothetical protein